MHRVVDVTLSLRTVSECNCTQHWRVKKRRHDIQKLAVKSALQKTGYVLRGPVLIKLTRYAPRTLDRHDNLPASAKWILDSAADYLVPGLRAGRADDDDRIDVAYDQIVQSKYAVRIEIYEKTPTK